jgi:hypothetical protein
LQQDRRLRFAAGDLVSIDDVKFTSLASGLLAAVGAAFDLAAFRALLSGRRFAAFAARSATL